MNCQFSIGDVVRIHPACYAFWQGLRFATVRKIGRRYVTVEAHLTGRLVRFNPQDLTLAE